MQSKTLILSCCLLLTLTGCFYTQYQVVQSDPPGAKVSYQGQTVGYTPVKVPLRFKKTTVVWGWLVDQTPEYIAISAPGCPQKDIPIMPDRRYVWPWWLEGSGTTFVNLR